MFEKCFNYQAIKNTSLLVISVVFIMSTTSCFNKENDSPDLNSPLQNSAFIGTWVEATPCESCRVMVMDIKANGTIVHTYPKRGANETYTYTLLSQDSIQVTRTGNIEPRYKTTTHKIQYIGADTIIIPDYLRSYVGVDEMVDIKLNR